MRILEVYSVPGKWYYLKYLLVLILLTIRNVSKGNVYNFKLNYNVYTGIYIGPFLIITSTLCTLIPEGVGV